MPSDIKPECGSTRGKNPSRFRVVLVNRDEGRSYTPALVMKRDDRDGRPGTNDVPYRVEWAATAELKRKAEAVLGRLEKRFSAKHNRAILESTRFWKGVPRHHVPPDAEVPVSLAVRIARAPIVSGSRAGQEPEPWEQELDAAALRAERAARAGAEKDARMTELFQWVPWFGELAEAVGEGRRKGLVERARRVEWAGGKCAVLDQGDDMADPLTFFYHLASIAGGKA